MVVRGKGIVKVQALAFLVFFSLAAGGGGGAALCLGADFLGAGCGGATSSSSSSSSSSTSSSSELSAAVDAFSCSISLSGSDDSLSSDVAAGATTGATFDFAGLACQCVMTGDEGAAAAGTSASAGLVLGTMPRVTS
ncbi:hypothetical protein JAAARDRAFT_247869 [Jaapia argillacea MUCL 33604]|uniref:Uncharacterized protein n=1 Tax=Jaapia argillacea MUCL 33604 TaxID=933084 RepID=A0A067QDS3_9AGAM|nr:hypothetical protein JAAARDRAFT_247869 [Jaapia argillacea MUCL 33604]